MLTGFDHITGLRKGEQITADYTHWEAYCRRNIKDVVKIIIDAVHGDDIFTCRICKENSLHYTKAASLGRHYKYQHDTQIIKYFLDSIVKLTPDELENIITNKHKSTPITNQGKLYHE